MSLRRRITQVDLILTAIFAAVGIALPLWALVTSGSGEWTRIIAVGLTLATLALVACMYAGYVSLQASREARANPGVKGALGYFPSVAILWFGVGIFVLTLQLVVLFVSLFVIPAD